MESEQKYKITIKPFSDGKLIHAYKSNPEFGYIVLESDELYFDESIHGLEFLKTNGDKSKLPKRQALLRGSIKRLEQFVEVFRKKNLSGRIRITEYLEHEIPENVKKANIRDDIPYEQAIKPFIKKYQHKIKSFHKEEIVELLSFKNL
jgi:sulfatase maturation enzyme AslB (radical SAM superfamily)